MLRKHIEFVQPKGSMGGFALPAIVIREANARYYFEDLPSTGPTDVVLNEETGYLRIMAIGGPVLMRAARNVSSGQAVRATATLTLTGVIVPGSHAESVLTSNGTAPANDVTVVIGARTYTFKTTLTGAANEVLIGASAAAALDNLKSAINATAGAGTTYGTGTVAHEFVVATDNADTTQKIQARVPGVAANTLATTESSATLSWADTTLGGGTGASNPGVTTAAATVTVNDQTYTFVDVLSEDISADVAAIPNQVLFGADSAAALDNLKLAVNLGATVGTNYSTGTSAPTDVIATTNGDTSQVFEAQTLGEAGNTYPATETLTNGSFGVDVTTFTAGSETANFDAFIAAGEAVEFGVDETVDEISLIALGATTDVVVVEY
jgi:hypothetical protein